MWVIDVVAGCDGVGEPEVVGVVVDDVGGAPRPEPVAPRGVEAAMDLLHVFGAPLVGGVVVKESRG